MTSLNYDHKNNPNVTYSNPLREFFILLFGIAVLGAVAFVSLGFSVEIIASYASTDFEKKLGKLFVNTMVSSEENQNRTRDEEYLQNIVNQLLPTLELPDLDYKVHILDRGDTINALALPGGNIVVMAELLRGAKSENEVVMVLGHELGHFKNRDQMRGLGRAMAFITLFYFISPNDEYVSSAITSLMTVTQLSFSREQEEEADEVGLDALVKYYGHAGGATAFFERIAVLDAEDSQPEFLSSHPLSEKRIEKIQELISERGITIENTRPLSLDSIPAKNTK